MSLNQKNCLACKRHLVGICGRVIIAAAPLRQPNCLQCEDALS